jgi:uncharacterized protein YfeS
MKQLQNEILQWHTATFPLSTIENQILKWKGEYSELEQINNYRSYVNELCDCIIVATAFKRFGEAGNVLYDILYNNQNSLIKTTLDNKKENWDFDDEIIERFVEAKLKINKQRKWEFINGVYKHIQE